MKIQIDFENKVITLLEKISLAELMIELKYRFPDKEWKEYSLDFIYRKYRLYPTLPNPIPDPYIPPFKITCGIVTPVQKVITSVTNDIISKYWSRCLINNL